VWKHSWLLYGAVWAQIAGGWSYDFLNVAPTARTAALGGIALPGENDLGAAFQNPALLRPLPATFQLTVQPYLADIFVSYLFYGREYYSASINTACYVKYNAVIDAFRCLAFILLRFAELIVFHLDYGCSFAV
jgi:hypothetical protein